MSPTLSPRPLTRPSNQGQNPVAGLPPEQVQAIRETIVDPVLFAQKWLQVDTWALQEEILRSVYRYPRVAVKACHSSSKTFTAAVVTLSWLARYSDSIVITTAPTAKQVEKLLWGEIHSLLGQSKYPFPPATLTQLKIGPKRYALGFTTSVDKQDEGVKFQGFHGGHVLIILDEAPGVEEKIWEAIEGTRAGGDVHVLAIGNPTISSGSFFDAFNANRAGWKTYTISAFSTPNFEGLTMQDLLRMERENPDELDRNVRPYLITRKWVVERYHEWGPKHPVFQSRVLGDFPTQAADSLISLSWLEQAKDRTAKAKPTSKYSAGIDVAGPGEDETVLVIRRDSDIVLLKAYPDADPRGELALELNPYRDVLDTVNVDTVGIGYYLARHLEDLGFPVSDINVGEAADDTERYFNLKSELYWGLSQRFKDGDVTGLDDEKAIAQLATIRYKPTSRGQIQIESKEDARKRGVKSPDRAEAVMLAFAKSRLHGLLQAWEEEAERLKKQQEQAQVTVEVKPLPDPQKLSDAQKQEIGWPEMFTSKETLGAKEGIKALGKIMTNSSQLDQCPCGNRFPSQFAEGVWKCNVCGRSGRGNQMYDQNGQLVPLS